MKENHMHKFAHVAGANFYVALLVVCARIEGGLFHALGKDRVFEHIIGPLLRLEDLVGL